jgi:hypothetical protein
MRRTILLLVIVAVLAVRFAAHARTKAGAADSPALDHVTMLGPSCPPYPCADISLQDQVRYLVGHWPRDFKIAEVQATENPKCKSMADRSQCTVRVKLINLILGTQEPDEGPRHSRTGWYDTFEITYSFAEANGAAPSPAFSVKSGDPLVAMLTPAKRPPNQPFVYISTRLDHASDALLQSVGAAVADTLTSAAHMEAEP